MAEEHTGMGEFHAECAKGLKESRKAAGVADDLDSVMPSPISKITPDVPHVRMVLRPGQRVPEAVPVSDVYEKVFGSAGTEE